MKFALKKATAKVAHVNVREEKNGEATVLAIDVKVVAIVDQWSQERFEKGLDYSKATFAAEVRDELLRDLGEGQP